MKVHSHSHTARKKWTHYFWEFLMLFLAVFCGFLAENQREHMVENKRAREYARGLISDLKIDRDEIQRGIRTTRFIINCIDSIISISAKQSLWNDVPGSFYYCSRFTTAMFRIDWSRSSIDQLIQSGNLRYFRNKQLVEDINFYYYMEGIINAQNQMDMMRRDEIISIRNQIISGRYYASFAELDYRIESEGHEANSLIDSLLGNMLPLQKDAKLHIDKFINHVSDRKSGLIPILRDYYTTADKYAEKIIKGLAEEYRLEDEL